MINIIKFCCVWLIHHSIFIQPVELLMTQIHGKVSLQLFRHLVISEKRLLSSSWLPDCLSAWNNSAPTGRIFIKFDIRGCFDNISWKWKFNLNVTRISGTSHEYLCIFMIISRGPGSSVGVVTDYGLDGPRSNPGGDEIFRPSRPALGPTQPHVQWVPCLSRG